MKPNLRPHTLAKQARERAAAAAAASAPEQPAPVPAGVVVGGPVRFPNGDATTVGKEARIVYRDHGRLAYVMGPAGDITLFKQGHRGEVPIPEHLGPTIRALFNGAHP